MTLWSPCALKHVMWQRLFQGASEFKVRNLIWNGSFCNLCALASLAGVTYLRYTVLTSPSKGETAVHCCDPPLSVLVMLVSRNVFHVVSALQSIVFIHLRLPFVSSLDVPLLQRRSHLAQTFFSQCEKAKKKI